MFRRLFRLQKARIMVIKYFSLHLNIYLVRTIIMKDESSTGPIGKISGIYTECSARKRTTRPVDWT